MDEKDRVFARFKGEETDATRRYERLTILRPAGASGSRVVDVVRLRGAAAGTDRPRRVDTHVRAESWDDGFPAKRTSAALSSAEPAPSGNAAPVTHVMPAWEPAPILPAADGVPAEPGEPSVAPSRGRGRPRKVAATWAPTTPSPDAAPVPPAATPVATRRGPGRPREETLGAPAKRIADPFDADDDRANCMRCGYAIEPARERRGLMTCAGCG
jgi:hypothetical protein